MQKLHDAAGGILVGNRIPKDFFITTGVGESDITIHAGSYHLALKDAGIEMGNIMTYSSILPGIANEITKPDHITHGEVIESIMAVAHGTLDEQIAVGIVFGRLYDKTTGQKYGGLVCEHNGHYTEEQIEDLLRKSLNELYINGFDDRYDLRDIRLLKNSFTPKKQHGTVLVALCFTNYVVPILAQ